MMVEKKGKRRTLHVIAEVEHKIVIVALVIVEEAIDKKLNLQLTINHHPFKDGIPERVAKCKHEEALLAPPT